MTNVNTVINAFLVGSLRAMSDMATAIGTVREPFVNSSWIVFINGPRNFAHELLTTDVHDELVMNYVYDLCTNHVYALNMRCSRHMFMNCSQNIFCSCSQLAAIIWSQTVNYEFVCQRGMTAFIICSWTDCTRSRAADKAEYGWYAFIEGTLFCCFSV